MPEQTHLEWTEKYRPKTLKQVRGNDKAISDIVKWANAWEKGTPTKKGLVLVGKPGTGKTSTVYALANDLNWGIIELNASDARNNENIRKIALAGSVNETFTVSGEFISVYSGGRKLIMLDEADNLFERMSRKDSASADMGDRGGKVAIIETLRKTKQPVILIVNDLYELTKNTGAPIKYLTEIVKFKKIRQPTIRLLLKQISDLEGIDISNDVLDTLSKRADGDARSAINDLQSLAIGNKKITSDQLKGVGNRNVKTNIFDALRGIFQSIDAERARKAAWDLDESPEDLILWLDENLPLEYRRPMDLWRGYSVLSKADVFMGRIRRRQYYGLWAYAKDLMTAGIAMAKHERYHGWVNYKFPSWLLKMSRTKEMRRLQKNISKKIGAHCHTSSRTVRRDILPYFKYIYRCDHDFAVNMSINLDIANEELSWLLDEKPTSNKVKYLLNEIKKTLDRSGSGSTKVKKDTAPSIFSDTTTPPSGDDVDGPVPNTIYDSSDPHKETATTTEPEKKAEVDVSKKDEKKIQKNLFDY